MSKLFQLPNIPTVSLVVPAYNESKLIQNTLERIDYNLANKELPYEILIVDDGSIDDTCLKAKNYGSNKNYIKVISYRNNVGKGYAIKTGFKKSKGDAIVFFDGDSDIDAKQIQRFLDGLNGADIVIGSKWHPDSQVKVPLVRKMLSHAFNMLARLLTGVKVSDTQTGIKALKRQAFLDVFERLCVKRYAFDVELIVLAQIYGLKVKEIPVDLEVTELFTFKSTWHMLKDLLGIAYRLRIRKWYQHAIPKHPDF